jgi:NDP-sugar pyrophosphorylase family protein
MADLPDSESFAAVILAGGRGSRLYPFTASLPKPLLPIGDRPLIELIVRQLVSFGAARITVAVNHLADLVETYLGDGRRFGLPIEYVRESTPLGTAGPLGLAKPWRGPLVVTNGDVLSDIDIRALLKHHDETRAALTVATMLQQTRVESGVLTTDSAMRVVDIVEKPTVEHRVSLGVYVLAEHVADLIGANERLEMPQLIMELVNRGETVAAYNHAGRWLDIGAPDDFARAQAEAESWSGQTGTTDTKAIIC